MGDVRPCRIKPPFSSMMMEYFRTVDYDNVEERESGRFCTPWYWLTHKSTSTTLASGFTQS